MGLRSGSRLGPYEVESPLGAGGMGEVYKARDTRLDRLVAVKVLPAAFATDADRLARFEREAKAVAALSHPNILAIFDSGVGDGQAYVVTELLEGQTLAERLQSGPIPTRKAIETAVQIARGLAAAHDKGFVHRDLKPGNVFLLADGQVKILDFGLAKPIVTSTETTAVSVTDPGAVVGTVGYMAPEQVRGQTVDARADLFAFGAVLYEMLTGRRAFKRDTAAETLTAILKDDSPELTGANTSPALERIVRHCLEKNPAERFQTARDVAFALEAFSGSAISAVQAADPKDHSTARRRLWRRVVPVITIALALGAAALAGRRSAGGRSTVPTFTPLTFKRQFINAAAFMPDGSSVVFAAMTQGLAANLYVLQNASMAPQSIPGASGLFSVSNNGELAVVTGCANDSGGVFCSLARMTIGTAPRAVLEQVRGADWAPDGSLAVIHVVGGKDRLEYPIGTVQYESSGTIGGARVSPDGSRLAFFDSVTQGDRACYVRIVDRSRRVTTLTSQFADCFGLAWAPDGEAVVFAATEGGDERRGQIHAVAATAGAPTRVLLASAGGLEVTDIASNGSMLALRHEFSLGLMAMLPAAAVERDVSWTDRSFGAVLSHDGSAMLFTDVQDGRFAVMLQRTDGSPPQRLGDGIAQDLSPDGKWALAFLSGPPSRLVVYPTGAGEPIVLQRGPIEQYAQAGAWLPDGRQVLVCGSVAARAPQCYVQDISGGGPRPVTPETVVGQWVSPDGRLLLAQGPDGLWQVVPIEGGPSAPAPGLRMGDMVAGWSKDGSAAFVTSDWWNPPSKLERVNLTTGKRTLVKELAPADRTGLSACIATSVRDDGRVYAYYYQRSVSTLYQIDGVNLTR